MTVRKEEIKGIVIDAHDNGNGNLAIVGENKVYGGRITNAIDTILDGLLEPGDIVKVTIECTRDNKNKIEL